jgi:hypothetical protein
MSRASDIDALRRAGLRHAADLLHALDAPAAAPSPQPATDADNELLRQLNEGSQKGWSSTPIVPDLDGREGRF